MYGMIVKVLGMLILGPHTDNNDIKQNIVIPKLTNKLYTIYL